MSKGETKSKITIPTRTARAKGGMFNNLRKPEQVESLSIEELTTPLDSTQLNSTQLNSTQLNPPSPDSTQLSPIAPTRDFNKRANSIERDALPAGLFPGTSKKLYDALYLRTRGAVVPKRTLQATRTEVMRWAGIGGLNTFLSHIKHLTRVGLIVREFEIGNKEGATYEVRLPEELDSTQLTSTRLNSPRLTSTQIDSTPDRVHDSTQNLMRVESSNPIENKDTSAALQTFLNTSSKTIDDEAAPLLELLRQAERELTGKNSSNSAQWKELADLLVTELRIAAARTPSVSNVPAFLTEHLRRRLFKASKEQMEQGSREAKDAPATAKTDATGCPDCGATGWWYPNGPDKGVARCMHLNKTTPAEEKEEPPNI